ncbi:MAG: hypothetical protein JNK82_19790 [Myxococcaceae bacterium]|nr:hypothetical protein [Myxococcaceae bacterium]
MMLRTSAVFLCAASSALAAARAEPVAEPPPPPPAVQASPPPAAPPPGAGAFGIRAGFGGGTATPGIEIGNVGAKFLVTDGISLAVDVGLGLTAASNYSQASFAADAVLGFYLRPRPASMRPYVPVLFGLGFSSRTTQTTTGGEVVVDPRVGGISVALGGGIGAEYWFSPSFSVAAELVLRISFGNFSAIAFNISTLTPGIHATYWF